MTALIGALGLYLGYRAPDIYQALKSQMKK